MYFAPEIRLYLVLFLYFKRNGTFAILLPLYFGIF